MTTYTLEVNTTVGFDFVDMNSLVSKNYPFTITAPYAGHWLSYTQYRLSTFRVNFEELGRITSLTFMSKRVLLYPNSVQVQTRMNSDLQYRFLDENGITIGYLQGISPNADHIYTIDIPEDAYYVDFRSSDYFTGSSVGRRFAHTRILSMDHTIEGLSDLPFTTIPSASSILMNSTVEAKKPFNKRMFPIITAPLNIMATKDVKTGFTTNNADYVDKLEYTDEELGSRSTINFRVFNGGTTTNYTNSDAYRLIGVLAVPLGNEVKEPTIHEAEVTSSTQAIYSEVKAAAGHMRTVSTEVNRISSSASADVTKLEYKKIPINEKLLDSFYTSVHSFTTRGTWKYNFSDYSGITGVPAEMNFLLSLTSDAGGGTSTAYIVVCFFDAENNQISQGGLSFTVRGSHSNVQYQVEVPKNAATFYIEAHMKAYYQGSLTIDAHAIATLLDMTYLIPDEPESYEATVTTSTESFITSVRRAFETIKTAVMKTFHTQAIVEVHKISRSHVEPLQTELIKHALKVTSTKGNKISTIAFTNVKATTSSFSETMESDNTYSLSKVHTVTSNVKDVLTCPERASFVERLVNTHIDAVESVSEATKLKTIVLHSSIKAVTEEVTVCKQLSVEASSHVQPIHTGTDVRNSRNASSYLKPLHSSAERIVHKHKASSSHAESVCSIVHVFKKHEAIATSVAAKIVTEAVIHQDKVNIIAVSSVQPIQTRAIIVIANREPVVYLEADDILIVKLESKEIVPILSAQIHHSTGGEKRCH